MTTPRDAIGLSERLRTKAAMITLGEKIAFGSETGLMLDAATQLDALHKELAQTQAHLAIRNGDLAEAVRERDSNQERVKELEASQQRQFDKYQAALKSGATSTPTAEGIAAAIRQTEYKYFGDYEFSESQWDAVHCLVNAAHHYLTAEARVKELGREVEAFHRHEQTLRDNGIASHTEAVVRVVDAESRATRAQQERDEAYERAAEWQRTLWFILRANDGFTLERDDVESFPGNDRAEIVVTRDNCDGSISFSAEIRSLASGPDKEKK